MARQSSFPRRRQSRPRIFNTSTLGCPNHASLACKSITPPRYFGRSSPQERILNPHPLHNLPMLHIFAQKHRAPSLNSRSHNQPIPNRKSISLAYLQGTQVCLHPQRPRIRAEDKNVTDCRSNPRPIETKLRTRNEGKLIQSLNADNPTVEQQFSGDFRSIISTSVRVNQHVRVKKLVPAHCAP